MTGRIARRVVVLALFAMGMLACGPRPQNSVGPAPPWKTGFWLWSGASVEAAAAGEHLPDVLYVQIGRIDRNRKIPASWGWPRQMPPAAEYWALWRYDPPARPADEQVAVIASDFKERKAEAAAQGRTVAGIQLDYDCPTGDLPDYAAFLQRLRRALPAGTGISITALLDWFRPGTHIRDVLANTSEFVPQFYDVAPPREGESRGIAEPVVSDRWGPRFNSFGVPYRIGITTFGRIMLTHSGSTSFFRDLTPLDVYGHPGLLPISIGQTSAGERRSVLRAERTITLNHYQVRTGDQIELITPTRHSVLAAYDAAKQMGGFCAGVVFFRWPSSEETLVLNPAEILGWVSRAEIAPGPPAIEAEEGDCVAAHCWDLRLRIADRMPERPAVLFIHSSRPIEYFLPAERIRSRISLSATATIKVELPAYHGLGTLFLGRCVTRDTSQFTLTVGK